MKVFAKILFILVALSATVYIYRPVLHGGYVLDDYTEVVDNVGVRHGFIEAASRGFFRSIPYMSFRLDYLLGGPSAAAGHITNLCLHILAALVLLLLWRSAASWSGICDESVAWWVGAVAGAGFLLHPLNVQAVSYISARGDIVAALFCFVAIACAVKAFGKGFSPGWYIVSIAAVCGGLISKETSVAGLFAATCAAAIVTYSLPGQANGKLGLRAILISLYLIFIPVYIFLRFSYKHINLGASTSAGEGVGIVTRLLWSMGEYARMMLWPVGLRVEHGPVPVSGMELVVPMALSVVAAVSCFISLAYIVKSRSRSGGLAAFAGLWWIAALAAVTAAPLADPVMEHRSYMAMGAFAGLPAIAMAYVVGRHRLKRSTITACCIILVLWAALSARQASYWGSPGRLWAHTVRLQPSSARGWLGLGSYMMESGYVNFARTAFGKSLAIDPSLSKAENNLGIIAMNSGDFDGATGHFSRAVEENPAEWRALVNLAVLEERRGNYSDAERYIRSALIYNPDYPTAWFNLGNILSNAGRSDEAIKAFEKAIALDPDNLSTMNNLAHAYEKAGRLGDALELLKKVIAQKPDFAPSLKAASRIEYKLGALEDSAYYMRAYLAVDADDAQAWRILADILKESGREAEAAQALQKAQEIENH